MFGVKFRSKHSLTHPDDVRLKTVLQQWQGIEPRANFESGVWRRIRTAAAQEVAAPRLWVILRGWLSAEPAWVHVMAATAGLLVGISMALSVPQIRTGANFTASLLHAQTLTGAYLTMVSGGAR